MLVLLDTANLETIRRLCDLLPIDGVTTNPTILKREGNSPMEQLKKIRAILPENCQLHIQAVSETAEQIVREARHIAEAVGGNLFVKIPVSAQGIKAMSALSKQGFSLTATAVYSSMQAFLAAKAGAKYVAPYINRLDSMGADGLKVTQEIQTIFERQNLDCGVLAASVKNTHRIAELCAIGIAAVTASPDVVEGLLGHPATDRAIEDFNSDFHSLTAPGKTLLDF